MPFPALVAAALQLAPLVPKIAEWIKGDEPNKGEKAALAVAAVAQAINPGANAEDALHAVINNPDQHRAFELAMQDKSDDMDKAFLADRADARAHDIKVRELNLGKNARADNLAYLAVLSFILTIVILCFVELPRGSRDILLVFAGAQVTIVKDVYGFDFGGSKGAERNAQTLSDYISGNGKKILFAVAVMTPFLMMLN